MAELGSRFTPAEIEKKWLEFWNTQDFYKPVDDPNSTKSDRKAYTIVIPPPNVTGILHMGHALNNTLQDILTRWKRMQGFNTLWLPGTDHASIATEIKVTEKLRKEGIEKHKIGREEFLKHAYDWTEEYGGTIINQLKLMGCSCDWSRERFTMDEMCTKAVRAAFKKLFDKGLIYRGNYLVNWCTTCRTVISNDEVEFKEKNGKLWHLRYPLKDQKGEFLIVATTRPETMLGDTAVAVNPKDERYKHLIGKTCILPLMNREIPIIADRHVDAEFGTGCVKVTPAHDPNDFEMGRNHDLEMINIMNEDGTLNENAGDFEGLDRFVGRKKVVAAMDELGLLEKIEDYKNNVGHCYRSKDVIEPYLSDQWFVKMKPLAEPAVQAVRDGRTKISPQQYENVYYHWMENVRDWPISRQLYWGHQIPIWYHKDDPSKMICWGGLGEPPEVTADPENWIQDTDILDTWFSSALWPFSTLGWPDETPDLKTFYPTDTLATAHEILFFWVARMIMMGLECIGEVPFSDVYIHAMIFDLKTKEKMSKSKGNTIDPLVMMEEYGTDAMRFTLCAYAIQGRNIYLSNERFEGYRNFMNKIWNASRFVMMNTESLDAETYAAGVKPEELKLEDKWILSELSRTIQSVNKQLGRHAFDAVGHEIYHFIWDSYCDWYVELTKPRVSEENEDKRDREVAQIILIQVLETTLRLMHPVSPFVTEELWQKLKEKYNFDDASIMIAAYPKDDDFEFNDEVIKTMARVQEVITSMRRLRAGMNIPPKEQSSIQLIFKDEATESFLNSNAAYFQTCVPLKELKIASAKSEDGFCVHEISDSGIEIHLEINEEQKQAELARINKEIPKLEKGLEGISRKLSNEKFVANAKPEIIEKEKKRQQELEADLKRAQEKLAALS